MREIGKFAFWAILALMARLIPHPPNFSPYASLIMLMGCQLSGRMAALITFITLMLSDILLAALLQYPAFGSWSIFTYTGFLIIALASSQFLQRRSFVRIATFSISAVLAYWLWTNFGTWLISGMYPLSSAGLLACFVAGLPFLQNSFWSAIIFEPLFFGLILLTERAWAFRTR